MKTKYFSPPEIQVAYHPPDPVEIIENSQQAYVAFLERWNHDTICMYEEFMVIYLNLQNAVIGHRIIGRGGIGSVIVDPKIVLGIALKCNSSSLLLAHNHPSGKLKPSFHDIEITKKLVKACKYHDIKLLDHTILTKVNYFSFADDGLLNT